MSDADHLADKHGCSTALVIVDMINLWNLRNGAAVRRAARATVPAIVRLIRSAHRARAAVIYANDNFGRWRSDLPALIEASRHAHPDGAFIVDAIAPQPTDYIVLKPEHSAFYATPLQPLLKAIKATRLVIVGATGDQCVLATAGDALLRDYAVTIPRDAIACANAKRLRAVLNHFGEVMRIPTPLSRGVRWHAPRRDAG